MFFFLHHLAFLRHIKFWLPKQIGRPRSNLLWPRSTETAHKSCYCQNDEPTSTACVYIISWFLFRSSTQETKEVSLRVKEGEKRETNCIYFVCGSKEGVYCHLYCTFYMKFPCIVSVYSCTSLKGWKIIIIVQIQTIMVLKSSLLFRSKFPIQVASPRSFLSSFYFLINPI